MWLKCVIGVRSVWRFHDRIRLGKDTLEYSRIERASAILCAGASWHGVCHGSYVAMKTPPLVPFSPGSGHRVLCMVVLMDL